MPARRIGIQVAADKIQLAYAALELGNGVGNGHSRRLRQLAHADKILGIQVDHALDEIVVRARPGARDRLVAEVMTHGRSAGREEGEIRAALLLDRKSVV